jgi:hypothetical protein
VNKIIKNIIWEEIHHTLMIDDVIYFRNKTLRNGEFHNLSWSYENSLNIYDYSSLEQKYNKLLRKQKLKRILK